MTIQEEVCDFVKQRVESNENNFIRPFMDTPYGFNYYYKEYSIDEALKQSWKEVAWMFIKEFKDTIVMVYFLSMFEPIRPGEVFYRGIQVNSNEYIKKELDEIVSCTKSLGVAFRFANMKMCNKYLRHKGFVGYFTGTHKLSFHSKDNEEEVIIRNPILLYNWISVNRGLKIL